MQGKTTIRCTVLKEMLQDLATTHRLMMDSFNYMLVLEQSVKFKGLEAMGILITIKSLGSCGIMESCIPVGSW